MSRRIVVPAYAKVNLTLEVLGTRADGYHELASVFATIGMRDIVRVAPARAHDVRVAPPIGGDPERELAARAVVALAEAAGREPHAHVRVSKRIPLGAGLGGGSSDAGATLRGLARVWRLDGVDLVRVAARVGSDVPFFASGAPYALVRGRGERVEALPAPREAMWLVLVVSPERADTTKVFAAHAARPSDGDRSRAVADRLRNGTATVEFLRAHLHNDLMDAARHIVPSIDRTRNLAARAGIDLAMSGSGVSLFALADDRSHALRMTRALRREGLDARPWALGVVP